LQRDSQLVMLLLDQIAPPTNPSRTSIDENALLELASSIDRVGMLEPIGVKEQAGPPAYRIVYGHRRYLAVQSLGWYTIKAEILSADLDESAARLAENTQRVDLTPVEEAREIQRDREQGLSIPAIATRHKKSETWVSNRVRLLAYPDDLLEAVHRGHLTISVADMFSHIDHAGYRQHMILQATDHGCTAATAAVWVAHYKQERARIIHNHEAVEDVARRRDSFVVTSPCEYCDSPTRLEDSRVWRLCPDCTGALRDATELRRRDTVREAPRP